MADIASDGDKLEANFTTGLLKNNTCGNEFACSSAPQFVIDVLQQGGIFEYYQANGFTETKG